MYESDFQFSSIKRELDYIKKDFKEGIFEVKKLKADRSYVMPEFESIKKEIDRIRVLTQELQKREHKCLMTEVINTMQKSIDTIKGIMDSRKNVKIGIVITIITMTSMVVANYVSLKTSVENSVSKSDDVIIKLESFERELEDNRINQNQLSKTNKEDIRKIFKEVVSSISNTNNNNNVIKNKKGKKNK